MLLLLIKVTINLAFAGLLCTLLRKAPASLRHLVWLSALAGVLLLPLLTAVVPAIHVALPFRLTQSSQGYVEIAETGSRVAAHASTANPFNLIAWIWICGALLSFVRAIYGATAVRRIAQNSRPIFDEAWLILLGNLSASIGITRPPSMMLSEDETMPLVRGLARPSIVLPASARSWPVSRRQMVLLHELAHITRRDLWWQTLATAATVAYWFHPLVWWAARGLRTESELACDERVLQSGVLASDYAAELLDVASLLRWRTSWSGNALAMARPSHLEGRVRAILSGKKRNSTHGKLAVLMMLFALLPAAAVQFGGDGAVIEGTISDASGALVGRPAVLLTGPAGTLRQVPEAGSFQFEGLRPGRYALEIRKPGFAPSISAVDVRPNQQIHQNAILQVGAAHETLRVPGRSVEFRTVRPILVEPEMQATKIIYRPRPLYPQSAKIRGISGHVLLRVTVGTDGAVKEATCLSAPDDSLKSAALDAVRQWRYEPTLLNGNPVDVESTIAINFTLTK